MSGDIPLLGVNMVRTGIVAQGTIVRTKTGNDHIVISGYSRYMLTPWSMAALALYAGEIHGFGEENK